MVPVAIPVILIDVELVTATPIVNGIDVEKVFGNTVITPTGNPSIVGAEEMILIGKFPEGAAESCPV